MAQVCLYAEHDKFGRLRHSPAVHGRSFSCARCLFVCLFVCLLAVFHSLSVRLAGGDGQLIARTRRSARSAARDAREPNAAGRDHDDQREVPRGGNAVPACVPPTRPRGSPTPAPGLVTRPHLRRDSCARAAGAADANEALAQQGAQQHALQKAKEARTKQEAVHPQRARMHARAGMDACTRWHARTHAHNGTHARARTHAG